MSALHPALLNRVFRKAIWKIKKDLRRISLAHIEDMVKFCFDRPSGISLDLPGRIRVYKNRDSIIIKKEAAPLREIGKKEKQSRQPAKKKQDRQG
jgi:tRNA(Ile)-lysidine synthase